MDSPRVPYVKPTTIRLDEATHAAVEAACERAGIGSVSEYIRQAVSARLAWESAVDTMRAGAAPDVLFDFEMLAEALNEIAERRRGQGPDLAT
jgi:Arc/MetJ-type ribon-helix-helix transcriptional regulator